jgi:hypothetical protein
MVVSISRAEQQLWAIDGVPSKVSTGMSEKRLTMKSRKTTVQKKKNASILTTRHRNNSRILHFGMRNKCDRDEEKYVDDERGERRPGDVGVERLLRSPEPLRNQDMVSGGWAGARCCERAERKET